MMLDLVRWLRHFLWGSDRRIALFFFCCYFLLQCIFLSSYGATWDEPLHRNWGKIFLVYLTHGQPTDLLRLMPGGGIYYSPLYYALSYLLSELLLRTTHLQLYEASHLINLLVGSGVVGGMYLLGRCVFTRRKDAWIPVLFLIGFPQFIAHSHYNPKDIPLLFAVLVFSIVWLRALRARSRTLHYLAAFLFGAAIAMKITAILVLPAVLISGFSALSHSSQTSHHHWIRRILSVFSHRTNDRILSDYSVKSIVLFIITTLILTALGLFIFWPSAWFHPSIIIESFAFFTSPTFWPGKELYFGTLYSGVDLPWHYIPFSYLVAMPCVMILSFIVGLRSSRTMIDPSQRIFFLLGIAVPLLLSIKPGIVRYDGMRQFFFILPFIVVFAAAGLSSILDRISPRFAVVILLLVIGSLFHEIVMLHPYEGSYRNELARFIWPKQMEQQFEIEYWGPTYQEGVAWLNDHASLNAEVCVPIAGALLSWYDIRSDLAFGCSKHSSYLMYFTRYREPDTLKAASLVPVLTIQRIGATLLRLYSLNK